MKVVIAEPIKKELSDLIKKNGMDWVVYEDFPKDKNEFITRVKDADIACSYFSKFDVDVLEVSPKLKYLAIAAVGAEASVDMDYANSNGVTVMNCPGYNSQAVAEIAVGLAFDIARSISYMNNKLANGKWANGDQLGRMQISGKKIGLIGYGNIGHAIHKILSSLCDDFLIINSSSSKEDIDKVVAESDVIFICCSLNDDTRGLISYQRLKMMKKAAILVNIARGAVVDEDALYEVLESKSIAGAGLDVFVDEPLAGEVLPESIARFTRLDNTVCLPHIAAGTKESGEALSQMIYYNILSCLKGDPQNIYS